MMTVEVSWLKDDLEDMEDDKEEDMEDDKEEDMEDDKARCEGRQW